MNVPPNARPSLTLDRATERALLLAGRPAARARARRALGELLDWTRHTGATRASTLTMHGSPVEFGFASTDDALRYCVEIADPRDPARLRVRQAIATLERLGVTHLDPNVLQRIEQLQSGRALRFGAWIGGRHAADADRYKLYVEVPQEGAAEAHEWSETIAGPVALPPRQRCRVALIGYDIDSSRIEFYYQARDMLPTNVGLLLRRSGMQSRTAEILDLLEQAYRFSRAGRLPSRDVGFSYSVPLSGGEVVFSIYFFCLALFGGDGRARHQILQLAAANDWRLPCYETLSEAVATAKGTPTRHGMLGLVVRPKTAVGITVGLSPPEYPCLAS